jgi:hypothetical protein
MRGNLLFVCCILSLLLLAPPAFAISYSASAVFDWSALSISGPAWTQTSTFQQANAVSCCPVLESFVFDEAWVPRTSTSTSGTATATSTVNDNQVLSSATLSPSPFSSSANADASRYFDVVLSTPGTLTVSIPYSMTLNAIGTPSEAFTAATHVSLGLNGNFSVHQMFLTGSTLQEFRDFTLSKTTTFNNASSIASTVSGMLRVGVPVETGARIIINSAASVTPVPEPNMLWLTLAGLVGIAVYAEWTRRRSVYAG